MNVYLNLRVWRMEKVAEDIVLGRNLKVNLSAIYGLRGSTAVKFNDRKVIFGRVLSVDENNIPFSLYVVTGVSLRRCRYLVSRGLITDRVIDAGVMK